MKFWVNNEEVSLNLHKYSKEPVDLQVVSVIDVIYDEVVNAMQVDFLSNLLVGVLWNLGNNEIDEYDDVVSSLIGPSSYTKNLCKLDLDLKNRETPAKPFIVEP